MDVVLGVAVSGPVARVALLGPGGQGADVLDQSVVDLGDNPLETLTETVVGTNRLLAGENHRLVGTRLCWNDASQAARLRQALQDSGVANVAVLSESQAVTALMHAAGRPGAALVMDDRTATLSVVGPAPGGGDAPPTVLAKEPLAGADATAMFDTMMARLTDRPDAPRDLFLLGASPELTRVADQLRGASTLRVQIADDPTFAIARGAAMAAAPQAAAWAPDATAMAPAAGLTGDATAMAPAAGLTGDATAMAPAAGLTGGDETRVVPPSEFATGSAAEQPQLAYSMADDAEALPESDEYGPEYDDYDETEAIPTRLSRRSLLVGNAVIAFAVIGFASLAVAVAVAVRPTASQQPVVGHQNAAPGKFMPLLPTQQQAPVPPPPVDQPNAGFQGGTVPAPAEVPQQVAPGGAGVPAAPVPADPGTPGYVPNPNPNVPIPVPVPIIIPYPGWQPGGTTTPTTTTTTTTPTTTTTTPTTTTTTPTTTTTTTTTTTPSTSTKTPFTATQTPTTAASHPTTPVPPHTLTQAPQPIIPQLPHPNTHH